MVEAGAEGETREAKISQYRVISHSSMRFCAMIGMGKGGVGGGGVFRN